jgi:hypothetical protein
MNKSLDENNLIDLIDNNLIKIVRPGILEKKFRRALKRINKLSNKYTIYMGIDYEFNTKKIALMQIMFQIEKKSTQSMSKFMSKSNIIKRYYVIYPPELSDKTIKYLKKYAMSNINILKILHGSESLDIPYIVDDFYNLESELILVINFFLSMIDTRYLCEYFNFYHTKPNICRIYDLLVNLEIIDLNTKEKLDENEQLMGAIYEIFIDINNLTSELITYSIHDVVYLIELYKKLKLNIIKFRPKDYFILVDSLRYSFMEKRLVSNIGDDIIKTNMMNNYWINIKTKLNKSTNLTKSSDKIIKTNMNKIFELILKEFIESYDTAKYIFSINYIKSNLQNILKLLTYNKILINNKVNASNIEIVDYNFNNNIKEMFENLKILEFNHLLEFIQKFQTFIDDKL